MVLVTRVHSSVMINGTNRETREVSLFYRLDVIRGNILVFGDGQRRCCSWRRWLTVQAVFDRALIVGWTVRKNLLIWFILNGLKINLYLLKHLVHLNSIVVPLWGSSFHHIFYQQINCKMYTPKQGNPVHYFSTLRCFIAAERQQTVNNALQLSERNPIFFIIHFLFCLSTRMLCWKHYRIVFYISVGCPN